MTEGFLSSDGPESLNAAAMDLWQQVFSRQAASPAATLVDSDHDLQAESVKADEAMRSAGWSDREILGMRAAERERERAAPVTSPGVNPRVEVHHAWLCDQVEGAMIRLGLDGHARVARGIEPRSGPIVSQIGVIMTDQSIVTVGSFFFRFCGLVARAYVRSLLLGPVAWSGPHFSSAWGRRELLRFGVAKYWLQIFMSYAWSGTNISTPYVPSRKHEVLLVDEVARSMELFAVAHEYGHHSLRHGRHIEGDAWSQEFEADRFDMKICDRIGSINHFDESPYLVSGAAASILLQSLETLRLVEAAFGIQGQDAATHPPVTARIDRFETIRLMMPAEHRSMKEFRTTAHRIMHQARSLVLEAVGSFPAEEKERFRSLRARARADEVQFEA